MPLKLFIRQMISLLYYGCFIHRLQNHGRILILMYHRILPDNEINDLLIQPGMYVTENTFNKQLNFLQSYCHIISFSEFLQRWRSNEWNPTKRYCVITFDDGWKDNYTNAYPLLKKYNIPATIFLTTSYIGSNKWFWPERLGFLLTEVDINKLSSNHRDELLSKFKDFNIEESLLLSLATSSSVKKRQEIFSYNIEILKKYPESHINSFLGEFQQILQLETPETCLFLDWKEIEEMAEHTIDFGVHCVSHRLLPRLSSAEIKKELNASLDTLKTKKVNLVPVLSYPNGDFNSEIIKLTKDAGYQAAVTTQYGWVSPESDNLFTLKRISIHNDISCNLPLFTFRLSSTIN